MKITIMLAFLIIASAAFSQELELSKEKASKGKYCPSGNILVTENNRLIMFSCVEWQNMSSPNKTSLFSSDFTLLNENKPLHIFKGAGYTEYQFFNIAENDNLQRLFTTRRNQYSSIEFGMSSYEGDELSHTWTPLVTVDFGGYGSESYSNELSYRYSMGVSDDHKKVGIAYFPEGNKGQKNEFSPFTTICFNGKGDKLWEKSINIPAIKGYYNRLLRTITDNNGNVFAFLECAKPTSGEFSPIKSIYIICAGPDFEDVKFTYINYKKSISPKSYNIQHDNNGNVYMFGICEELNSNKESMGYHAYYVPIIKDDGENIVDAVYINDKNKTISSKTSLYSINRGDAQSNMRKHGILPLDEKHIMFITSNKTHYSAYIIGTDGTIADEIHIDFNWNAACTEEVKTPYFEKIEGKIYLFYQGIAGSKDIYDKLSDIKPPLVSGTPKKRYPPNYDNKIPVAKYLTLNGNSFVREDYTISGTEGFGMPARKFKINGENYYFFSQFIGNSEVAYKIAQIK